MFYHHLAYGLSCNINGCIQYSQTLACICCMLSFSLLISAIMCIPGNKSISHQSTAAFPELGHIDGHREYQPAIAVVQHTYYVLRVVQ